ncbi:MAG: universal stress protein [Anaerolineales bacterium]
MPGVICPIRGGPSSQPTIKRAIALAKGKNLELHFLYVVNLDFLTHTERSRVRHISEEMHEMGEFILLTAQEAAIAEGISAKADVRHGDVAEEIVGLAKELEAGYIIMGRPLGKQEEDVFSTDRLERFIERLESESGAKVILEDKVEG